MCPKVSEFELRVQRSQHIHSLAQFFMQVTAHIGELLVQVIQTFMHKQLVLTRSVRIRNLAGFVNVQGQHQAMVLGIAHGFEQRQVFA